MRLLVLSLAVCCLPLPAQWALQDSHSKASLRGIDSLGGGIAWASGTAGTILRTTNGGDAWQACAVPPGAEKLDFRGIQAFNATTAVAMSSGPGDQSRIYKTSDACQTWKLVFTNPDKDGFWDGLRFSGPSVGALIGDPVDGKFPIFLTEDGGNTWHRRDTGVPAETNQSLFAASNSAMLLEGRKLVFVTGGGSNALIEVDLRSQAAPVVVRPDLAIGAAAGGFSVAMRTEGSNLITVVVGGDYKTPAQDAGTAVTCNGIRCQASTTRPAGYRSAVAYDDASKTWVAVGPNGTDVSGDDGRNWHPVPNATDGWNAISLPFAVGPNGRIGRLTSGR